MAKVKTDNKTTNLKMIDLFAGIGGIRLGFEKAFKDIETVFSCELDKNAAKTYNHNFKQDPTGDITKINEKEVPDFDVVVAGFPCQTFSIAGKRLGFEEARGTLFFDVARIIKEKKPSVVFLENVKGLTNHDKGKTLKVILATLEELGYSTQWKVLNSKDFGLPQKRERTYIVAFNKAKVKNHADFKFPAPSKTIPTVQDILQKNVELKHFLSKQYLKSLKAHKERHKNKGNGFGYEVIQDGGIANTIVVGGMGRERNLIVDKSKPTNNLNKEKDKNTENLRVMTVREWARLQGFPDDYNFPVADGPAYKQLGNSVAINVISAIAKEIKKVL
jgi:DNA (cytosine-5)-methyltransferase 1